MTIIVNGVPAVLSRFATMAVASEAALAAAVDTLGHDVETAAKRMVPVDTGDLKDSITYEPNGPNGRVYTDLEYAGLVEYGGPHNVPPEPYMRPAADTVDDAPAIAAAKAVIDSA